MTHLATSFRHYFSRRSTSLGDQYFQAGQVDGERPGPNTYLAHVHGYCVEIELDSDDEEGASASCGCRQFGRTAECAHVWATLRQLDALAGHAGRSGKGRKGRAPRPPAWKLLVRDIVPPVANNDHPLRGITQRQSQAWYVINVTETLRDDGLSIEFFHATRKRNGSWGKIKKLNIHRAEILAFTDLPDRVILEMLMVGPSSRQSSDDWPWFEPRVCHECSIPSSMYEVVLPRMADTGRLVWLLDTSLPIEEASTLSWDDGPPWQLQVRMTQDDTAQRWSLRGELVRDESVKSLDDAVLVLSGGLVIFSDVIARFDASSFAWVPVLRRTPQIPVPYADRDALLNWMYSLPNLPRIVWPDNIRVELTEIDPQGRLVIKEPQRGFGQPLLLGDVTFQYADTQFAFSDPCLGRFDAERSRAICRNRQQERQLLDRLQEFGVQPHNSQAADEADVQFHPRHFATIVHTLTTENWIVEAEGRRVRQPGHFQLNVTTSVDWFELDGRLDFDGAAVPLPSLLAALRSGDRFIRLDDGSHGMLPEEWLARYGPLARLSESEGDTLRFAPSHALLLDALLAEQDPSQVQTDAEFRERCEKLRSFSGVHPAREPCGFHGRLRDYQRDGLGWLHFLRDFGCGGCLADDMGLGKTVQVLALLYGRRSSFPDPCPPSLVVVPKSLVFNWIDEGARFAPQLRMLNYTGASRHELWEQMSDCDVLVTTYGTLRRDILKLKEIRFDYAILDEAQAIKNHHSQSSKACRLLQADHRLAMTGTPVENHMGELWSLFEFLNPGMLGRSEAFASLAKNGASDPDTVQLLAKAIRPYVLRRTKTQVLRELPEKMEQTLYCELSPKERKHYDELKTYYRQQLGEKMRQVGLQRSKIHVLEALLRLRQAACHPGLLDRGKSSQSSAKLETLLEQLAEVMAEGHKALVFSQFTSFLAIIRQQLDHRNLCYEYLDGRTRKRGDKVRRFQEDPSCPLFLISLKAGGQGLNLTAADYVFILDPWWNPAVEAQAIDRAHRIGQTQRVFAYRLIAQDTVEQKILELQATKRELADAIITADNSIIRSLTADDLQLLLS